jgi:hypothetical protein
MTTAVDEEPRMEIFFQPSLEIGSSSNAEAIKNFIEVEKGNTITIDDIIFYKMCEFELVHIWHKNDPTKIFVTGLGDLYCYAVRYPFLERGYMTL